MALAAAVCSSLIISCNFSKDIPVETTKVAVNKLFAAGRTCLQVSSVSQEPLVRRSGNYKPCLWDYNFFQSLNTVYRGESFNALVSELKEDVKLMFKNVVEPLDQLELIDHLQKLAIGYHFDEEIKSCLKNIYDYDVQTNSNQKWGNNLHATALKFRLLREHGYLISSEVFDCFTENQRFKDCISKDLKGILSLYEASYYSIEGELLMEEACSFTSTILKEHVEHIDDLDLGMQVKQALELPLQWRIPRFEAKWYIDIYEKNTKMIPSVLKLAKLDFNIVQGSSQEELIEVSRWWNTTGLGEKLDFIRDRLASSFLWSVGISCKPQHAYFRIQMTKVIQFVSIVDDIYDVYGTLDELELFTSVIQRWDITAAASQLPYYMKICFMSLHNLVNDIAYDILKEHNIDVLPHLRKSWTDLVKCYIVEARWFHGGYKPTFNEFLSNGLVTFGGPMAVLHFYVLTSNLIRKEAIQLIEDLPDIARLASEICRLADDNGTSTEELKRGDIPKSIQCYMMDTAVSEQVARKHMIDLMRKKWQKMMKSRYSSDEYFPILDWSEVENLLLNLVRVTHCTYNSGNDGFGVEGGKTKERMFSLFIEPIPAVLHG